MLYLIIEILLGDSVVLRIIPRTKCFDLSSFHTKELNRIIIENRSVKTILILLNEFKIQLIDKFFFKEIFHQMLRLI
jgi:hypothetical protein